MPTPAEEKETRDFVLANFHSQAEFTSFVENNGAIFAGHDIDKLKGALRYHLNNNATKKSRLRRYAYYESLKALFAKHDLGHTIPQFTRNHFPKKMSRQARNVLIARSHRKRQNILLKHMEETLVANGITLPIKESAKSVDDIDIGSSSNAPLHDEDGIVFTTFAVTDVMGLQSHATPCQMMMDNFPEPTADCGFDLDAYLATLL